MFHRPARPFVIKFLGLWGLSQPTIKNGESEKDVKNNRGWPTPTQDNEATSRGPPKSNVRVPIDSSSRKIVALMLEKGLPGLTVSVSKQGEELWRAAFGYCDVENQLLCVPEAEMKIASISKPLFAATVVAPMIEQNKLDLNTSVHHYLSEQEFPKQKFQGKEYDITVRQLLSHTSGIKHYPETKDENETLRPIGSKESKKVYQNDDQYNRIGFFQRQTFRDVIDALEPFKEGPLVGEPGKFSYTTYGYTLLSAVVQKARQQNEPKSKSEQIEDFWLKVLRREWDMQDTYLDQDEVIISNRARYYLRKSFNGGLINAPYQDSSVKWAGGGIVSTTVDLVKFANKLIDCYKNRESKKLKRETVELLWKEVEKSYGLGFMSELAKQIGVQDKLVIYHTGNALGASSVLIIYPESEVVVAILTNIGSINLKPLGIFIADEFDKSC